MSRVELRDISKSFGGITALKNVTFEVVPGEIHALVGENGAGKSTLMKILSGAYTKDAGQILIDDREVHIRNTNDSRKLGISIIYQEFSLVPALSVSENIFLSNLGEAGMWLKWSTLRHRAKDLINSIGYDIDPSAITASLSIAEQQIVEIAKALAGNVRVLILDEPSAVLGPREIIKLFDTLDRLKKEGVAIIYISHHLSEVFQIADRITVLKDGSSSGTLKTVATNKDSVIRLMLGRPLNDMYPQRNPSIGKEMIKAEDIFFAEKVKGVTFSVREGEIAGIAGLTGSGRSETARTIFGAEKMKTGRLWLSGREIRIASPHKAVINGIGMVPEDRKLHGVILALSVMQNISITNLKNITGCLGFIKRRKERNITNEMIRRLSVKTNDPDLPAESLSGGSQQKVSLAKWLDNGCRILIIDEPTRGIDVGAKVEIYKLINDLSHTGVAIIVISSETSELIGICDRIMVMRNGTIEGILDREEYSEEAILRLAIGAN